MMPVDDLAMGGLLAGSMYGSDAKDLVKYYDLAFGRTNAAELAWYLDQADAAGGPVLDLACGTGRLAIALAERGHDVTALDASEGMLSQFKKKLTSEPVEIRQRIVIDRQPMSAFSLGRRFQTIICCDAFFHNSSVEEEMDCLALVREHLAPGGRFTFNLPNPTCAFLTQAIQSAGTFIERGRYPMHACDDVILVEQAQSCDLVAQVMETRLRITRLDAAGEVVEQGLSSWRTRYLWPYEAVHLLYRCGFKVERFLGDYGGGAVTEAGQLIFVATLA